MKLLAFETATEACSVALWIDGEVRERFELAPRRHAELSLPWAEQLLAEAGIAQVATGRDRASAAAPARSPGCGWRSRSGRASRWPWIGRCVPVSTLAALAMQSRPLAGEARVKAASCARRRWWPPSTRAWTRSTSVAFALRDGDAFALGDEMLVAPDAIAPLEGGRGWYGVGTGFAALDGSLVASAWRIALRGASKPAHCRTRRMSRGWRPRPWHAARRSRPNAVEPAYLRNNVALTIAEQQALRDSRRVVIRRAQCPRPARVDGAGSRIARLAAPWSEAAALAKPAATRRPARPRAGTARCG